MKNTVIQGVILAAGYGSRMGDIACDIPKPMLSIKNRPLLEYKIHVLPKEVTEVIFVVGHQCHHIMNYFGSYYAGRTIRYALQSAMNGTADALHVARPFLGERFMVLMGDDLYAREDLKKMVSDDLAILGHHYENAQGKGIIIADENGMLSSVKEQIPDVQPGLVNAAAYMLTKKFFEYAPAKAGNSNAQEVGLPQTLSQMSDKHAVAIHQSTAWMPITTPEDIVVAERNIHKFL